MLFSSIFRPSSHYYIAIRWYFRTITNSIKSDIYFTTYQEMILRFKMLLLADLMIEIERVYRNVQSCGLHCFSPFCRDQIFSYSPPVLKRAEFFKNPDWLKFICHKIDWSLPVINCLCRKPDEDHIKPSFLFVTKALCNQVWCVLWQCG